MHFSPALEGIILRINLKNIHRLIIVLPLAVVCVLFLVLFVFAASRQYRQVVSYFDGLCGHYATALDLQLTMFYNSANLITGDSDFTDNISLDNFSPTVQTLVNFQSSRRYASKYKNVYKGVYIIDRYDNIYSSALRYSPCIKTYSDVEEYTQNTLLSVNANDEINIVCVIPIYTGDNEHIAALINILDPTFLQEPVPDNFRDIKVTLHLEDGTSVNLAGANTPFLTNVSKTIPVADSGLSLSVTMGIASVVKSLALTLVIFGIVFALMYAVLKFLSHCLYESIHNPLENIEQIISDYADNTKAGGATDE